jgi:hypothetical protein
VGNSGDPRERYLPACGRAARVAGRSGGAPGPGQEIALRIDQTLLQDATGTMASLQFAELAIERVAVPLAVQYVDHNMIQLDYKNPDDHEIVAIYRNDPAIKTLVLSASIRHPRHIIDSALAGADIATCPFKVLEQSMMHPLTDSGIERFLADWQNRQ